MFTFFRFIYIAIQSYFFNESNDEWSQFRLRAMPWDCDPNLHINNAKYLTILDLARAQLFFKNGFFKVFSNNRWTAVVTSANVVYRRSINLWTSYTVRSRIAYKTDRLIVLEHVFEGEGILYAHAYIAIAFLENGKMIPIERLESQIDLAHILSPEPGSSVESVVNAAYEIVKNYK